MAGKRPCKGVKLKKPSLLSTLIARHHRQEIFSQKEYWNFRAEGSQGRSVSMCLFNPHLNCLYESHQLKAIREFIPDLQGKKVLDAGCGTGRISRFLASQGAEVVGIDFADKVIAIARQETPVGNPVYLTRSLFDLDETGSYDIAFSVGVLVSACRNRDELLRVLNKIGKALKPAGKLVLIESIHQGFFHSALDMDKIEFLDTLKEAGFEINEDLPMFFLPMRLILAYIPWPKWATVIGYKLGIWAARTWHFPGLADETFIVTTVTNKKN